MAKPRNTDESAGDQASRAVLLAFLESALTKGDHDRAEDLRRQLAALGVTVRLGVVRPSGDRGNA